MDGVGMRTQWLRLAAERGHEVERRAHAVDAAPARRADVRKQHRERVQVVGGLAARAALARRAGRRRRLEPRAAVARRGDLPRRLHARGRDSREALGPDGQGVRPERGGEAMARPPKDSKHKNPSQRKPKINTNLEYKTK